MRFPFFTDTSVVATGAKGGNDSLRTDRSSAKCPVSAVKPSPSDRTGSDQSTNAGYDRQVPRCPIAHAPDAVNPHNNMPVIDQTPLPSQNSHLSTSRVTSSIPRSATSYYPGIEDNQKDYGMTFFRLIWKVWANNLLLRRSY